jgi:glycerophosphoryl diester phosphodiesterase
MAEAPGSPPADPGPAVQAIAHRGFSGLWPENTAQAFTAALAADADMIELDARRTAGERVAVVHDDDLSRYGHAGLRVSELDLADLARLDAGRWLHPRFAGTCFLGLREALERIGGAVAVNVEVKVDPGQEPHIGALVESTLEEIDAAGSPPVLLSTFSREAFERLRVRAPGLPAALLIGRGGGAAPRLLDQLVGLGAEGVHVERSLAAPPLVEAARARGLKVRVYTVNEPSAMRALAELGVDGIVTDWPDRLLAVLWRR